MSHINVTINGRQYRMACEEGQEVRLLKLAESLESRVDTLRGKFGEIGDARLTVMAALTVCDELLDASAEPREISWESVTTRRGGGSGCLTGGGVYAPMTVVSTAAVPIIVNEANCLFFIRFRKANADKGGWTQMAADVKSG